MSTLGGLEYLGYVSVEGWGLFMAAGGSFSAREWSALAEEAREALAKHGRALDAASALLLARALGGGEEGYLSVQAALDGGEGRDEAILAGAADRALKRHWPTVAPGRKE